MEERLVRPQQFRQYLDRDLGRCYHCGSSGDTLVPQHRSGRGMGGSKSANRSSNIITFCSLANGLIESDSNLASIARNYGWKISRWEDPATVPVFEIWSGLWWLLADDGSRTLDRKKPQSSN